MIKADGKQLYTSQLFWNQATKKIYSNVDSKIVNGDEVTYCEGFESDENMKEWRYRKIKGITFFTVEDADSTSTGRDSVTGIGPDVTAGTRRQRGRNGFSEIGHTETGKAGFEVQESAAA